MAKKIKGTLKFIDLEGGFWGIVTPQGNYAPLELPEQLKKNGQALSCTVEEVDVMTAHNWGIPCKIISFTTFDAESVWNS